MPTDNRGGKHAPNGRRRGEEDPEAQGGLSTEGKGREQEEWRPSTALVPSLRAHEMWSSVGDSWKRFSRLRNRSSHVAAVEGTSSEGDLIRSNARLDAAMDGVELFDVGWPIRRRSMAASPCPRPPDTAMAPRDAMRCDCYFSELWLRFYWRSLIWP
jgi:hypothetical protein